MDKRIYNFSSGPAVLPLPVLERARDEMLSLGGAGMSVMEMSHRSKRFAEVLDKAESGLRSLLAVPENFRILFIQGGGSLQFSMVPMNFLGAGGHADYVVTGHWGKLAADEASIIGDSRTVYTSADSLFSAIPGADAIDNSADAAYLHYVANETIEGVEFNYDIDGNGVPVVCDMSSNILSKRIDWQKYSLIYAGAQKNIGPSGVAVVIVSDEMLAKVQPSLPSVLDYQQIAANA